MINSLESAIKHCEEEAERNEYDAKIFCMPGESNMKRDFLECASEHRQLAEWLRELKKYREILTELDEAINCYENCETCQGFREYSTSQFIKDVIQINKEVNADGDSD